MNYGNAFTYFFSSRDWVKKVVLGVAMGLMPVLGPIVLSGWALDVLRNLTRGGGDPIPEWTGDDFSRWLGRGIGLSVAVLTFLLPVIVLALLLFVFNTVVVGVLGSQAEDVASFLAICLGCIMLIIYFAVFLGAQVVIVRYASTDRLDVGLDYIKTFQLVVANIVPLLVMAILYFVWSLVSVILIVLTLGIFAFVVPVFSMLIFAYFGSLLAKQPGFSD